MRNAVAKPRPAQVVEISRGKRRGCHASRTRADRMRAPPRFRSALLHFVVIREDDGACDRVCQLPERSQSKHDFRTCLARSGMTQSAFACAGIAPTQTRAGSVSEAGNGCCGSRMAATVACYCFRRRAHLPNQSHRGYQRNREVNADDSSNPGSHQNCENGYEWMDIKVAPMMRGQKR
jgi:hypothetical protein